MDYFLKAKLSRDLLSIDGVGVDRKIPRREIGSLAIR